MKILRGLEGYSIPLDAPLYGEPPLEYSGCEALLAVAEIDKDSLMPILPIDLEPLTDPPICGYFLAHYPFSTVGEYYEVVVLPQVRRPDGEWAYYIPYIYVTNEVALAAGREIAGAPKKLAHIEIVKEGDVFIGTLERPKGKRLMTISVAPRQRAEESLLNLYMPKEVPLVSLRMLPKVGDTPPIAQLIDWAAEICIHTGAGGEKNAWTGEAAVTFDSPSSTDPVHKLKITEVINGMYVKFDMKLKVNRVLRTYSPTAK
jgi:acetoacetate decarboxylase